MVLKRNIDDHGYVFRYIGCLVANWYVQMNCFDCGQTFEPSCCSMCCLRLLERSRPRPGMFNMRIFWITFLNGTIDGDLYVTWDGVSYKVERICGQKQSLLRCSEKLKETFEDFELKQLEFCKCIFHLKGHMFEASIFDLVEVLVILSAYIKCVTYVKNEPKCLFKLTDLGELYHCFGVSFEPKRIMVFLTQWIYYNRNSKRCTTWFATSALTPMLKNNNNLTPESAGREAERSKASDFRLRSIIGSLLYLKTHINPKRMFW